MTATTDQLEANKKLARDYIDQVFNQHNPGKAADFSAYSFTVRNSVFRYGDFVNQIISFVIIAAAVYFFVWLVTRSIGIQ